MAQVGSNQTSIQLGGKMRAWKENHGGPHRGLQKCVIQILSWGREQQGEW